jgi:hypothetical protein
MAAVALGAAPVAAWAEQTPGDQGPQASPTPNPMATPAPAPPGPAFRLTAGPQTPQRAALLQAAREQLLAIGRKSVVNRATGYPFLPNAAGEWVPDDQTWIRPSDFYPDSFSRDTYWILGALQSRALLEMARQRFHGDQLNQPDGHVATTLRVDLIQTPTRDWDDESTLMDVLREYEYTRLGGTPDMDAMGRAFRFIQPHIQNGLYATTGDPNTGAYHYWADTLRLPLTQAITYNQGLLCVALEALDRMGFPIGPDLKAQAQKAYGAMTGPGDSLVLPQRQGGTTLDSSALVGDALYVYYFDKPLLPDARVKATFDKLLSAGAVYDKDAFIGFRVLANPDGTYLKPAEFLGPDSHPGYYQNGGSWLLYDVLALYSAASRGVLRAGELLGQRLLSEFDRSRAFHEFTRTAPYIEDIRVNYGWNAFVARLLA